MILKVTGKNKDRILFYPMPWENKAIIKLRTKDKKNRTVPTTYIELDIEELLKLHTVLTETIMFCREVEK